MPFYYHETESLAHSRSSVIFVIYLNRSILLRRLHSLHTYIVCKGLNARLRERKDHLIDDESLSSKGYNS